MYYVIHVMIVNLYGTGTHVPRGPFVCYCFKSVHMIKNLCRSSCRLTLQTSLRIRSFIRRHIRLDELILTPGTLKFY